MDTFTISAAARICHCDRRTLQRAIHAGRLHLDPQQRLSREELLAAGSLIAETPRETPRVAPRGTPQAEPQLCRSSHSWSDSQPPLKGCGRSCNTSVRPCDSRHG
jgi:hypothetical protein